jgi:outer membrane lipoprotein carrier protein
MKKNNIINILLLSVLTFYRTYGIVEHDEKALVILDQVNNYYQSLSSFKAKFIFLLKNKEENEIMESYKGTITIQGENYKLQIANQEIVKKDNIIWNYIEDNNEITIIDYQTDNEEINLYKLHHLYKTGYSSNYVEETIINDKVHHIIELIPENQEHLVSKITLLIDKETFNISAWEIHTDEFIAQEYIVKEFYPNIELPEDYFSITPSKYPNVQITDLRE